MEQLQSLNLPELKSYGIIYNTIINQAFIPATDDIFKLSAWIFIILFFLTWFAKPRFVKSSEGIAAE